MFLKNKKSLTYTIKEIMFIINDRTSEYDFPINIETGIAYTKYFSHFNVICSLFCKEKIAT